MVPNDFLMVSNGYLMAQNDIKIPNIHGSTYNFIFALIKLNIILSNSYSKIYDWKGQPMNPSQCWHFGGKIMFWYLMLINKFMGLAYVIDNLNNILRVFFMREYVNEYIIYIYIPKFCLRILPLKFVYVDWRW